MRALAVQNQRARVVYRLPEQRRFGANGLPGMAAIVLLALVLFLGGLVVGRASMTGDRPAAAAPATTVAAPATTTAEAPPASNEATADPGTAATSGRVGPRQVVNGVGTGYAHTQEGAVAAAANYTRVLSSSLILDPTSRRQAIDTLAAPEARRRLQRTFELAVASVRDGLGFTGAAGDGPRVLMRATPVGWRVEKYDGDEARVAIWVTSVAGSLDGAQGAVPVREGWGTTTVRLRWVDGDWKQLDTTTEDGPTPIADVSPPTAAAELIDEANQFKEFTYAPGP